MHTDKAFGEWFKRLTSVSFRGCANGDKFTKEQVKQGYTAGVEYGSEQTRIDEVIESIKLLEYVYKIINDQNKSDATALIYLKQNITRSKFYLKTYADVELKKLRG